MLLFILSTDSKISSIHTFVWDSLSNFSSSKKEFSVGLYLCSSRVNIITRNYLSFFTASTLFSSSFSPFAPSSSINSTDSLANFLFLDVSEDGFTVSFYSVNKLFLKTFFFGLQMVLYLWFAFNLLVFKLERICRQAKCQDYPWKQKNWIMLGVQFSYLDSGQAQIFQKKKKKSKKWKKKRNSICFQMTCSKTLQWLDFSSKHQISCH